MNRSLLVIGGGAVVKGGVGWHTRELVRAAGEADVAIEFADYESLSATLSSAGPTKLTAELTSGVHQGQQRVLSDFDSVLARTMPAGSLETITFRLAVLHSHQASGGRIVNPPRSLELAIDKFATLAEISRLGMRVPETIVVQNFRDAIDAFDALGGDVVVKPLFGGEGRGVMRIQDRELAWTTFRTLHQLQAVLYVQKFVRPGGADRRCLLIGDHAHVVRRRNESGFRTNVASGSVCELADGDPELTRAARRIARHLGLTFCSVDFLDTESGVPIVVEVNAIPGWRGSQSVIRDDLAGQIIAAVK